MAYDQWARGREQFNTLTREGILEARRLFAAAIERDPRFARALGQLANTYVAEQDLQYTPRRADVTRAAVELAKRAVAIDPVDSQLRWVLSRTLLWDSQYEEAIAEMRTVLQRDPDFANGHAFMTQILTFAGRAEDALPHIERALRMEVYHPFWYYGVRGNALFMLGRYEEAVADYRRALERNANSIFSRRHLASALGHLGRISEAEWEIAELETQIGRPFEFTDVDLFIFYVAPSYRDRLIEGLRKAGLR
ncbi:MAG: tetratricopeptide repeat protein [Alphaproteobacteria bacterium]|nr:tetratricopeptide repeat protein [Alphaproteobacteria bacterium]